MDGADIVNGNGPDANGAHAENELNDGVMMRMLQQHRLNNNNRDITNKRGRFFTYSTVSVVSFVVMIYWAFYTRQQFYLAVVYLASSKLAHVVIGNFLICCSMSTFLILTNVFLNGLRSTEQEAISDGLRWSLMETALAMTLFREEVSRYLVFWFLGLAVAKCLHWAVEFRGRHMQQTDAVFIPPADNAANINNDDHTALAARSGQLRRHMGFLTLSTSLLVLDLLAVVHCATTIAKHGPSVHILFGFEAAIMLVSSTSTLTSYILHVIDYIMHSKGRQWHAKSTVSFAFEVAFEACKFIFYLAFFTIVFIFYGLPINLIRDVYVSYVNLRRKVESFHKYRQLTFNMNEQFDSATEEELVSCGHVCIICRDHMGKGKKLACGHVFHFFCLREWLQQQQTCPTCRAEIPTKSKKKDRDRRWQWARRQIVAAAAEEEAPANQTAAVQEDNSASTAVAASEERPHPQSVEEKTTAINAKEPSLTTSLIVEAQPQPSSTISSDEVPEKNIPSGVHREEETYLEKTEDDEVSPFPCFYRVINRSGANVYTFSSDEPLKLVRTVPPNKVILCLEMKWFSESKMKCGDRNRYGQQLAFEKYDDEQENMINSLSGKMILRMPDGWVSEYDIERVPIPVSVMLEQLMISGD